MHDRVDVLHGDTNAVLSSGRTFGETSVEEDEQGGQKWGLHESVPEGLETTSDPYQQLLGSMSDRHASTPLVAARG
jgi:hypothetical protein